MFLTDTRGRHHQRPSSCVTWMLSSRRLDLKREWEGGIRDRGTSCSKVILRRENAGRKAGVLPGRWLCAKREVRLLKVFEQECLLKGKGEWRGQIVIQF